MSNHGDAISQSSTQTTEDQRPKKNELDKKFVVEEMYGTKGAYPSGEGATLVLGKADITYNLATQVSLGLKSSASRSQDLNEMLNDHFLQDSPCSLTPSPVSTEELPPEQLFCNVCLEYPPTELFSNLFLQDSPCSFTPSSPVSTEELSITWILRNDRYSHAEISYLRGLEREVQRLEREGGKVTKINVELIQNYAPCHECADEMISFKETMERERKEVSIRVIFANYYYWIGRHRTDVKGWKNLLKLKEMHGKDIDLQLLQGKEQWETLFKDSDLVNLKDKEREELLQKATSEKRQKREEYDRKLRDTGETCWLKTKNGTVHSEKVSGKHGNSQPYSALK